MSNFATAMKLDKTLTWNGADSLSTPGCDTKGRISLFFKGLRDLNAPSLYDYLREAANENILDTFILVFNIRDCRGGKGERLLGRRAFVWLFLNYPLEMSYVAPLIVEYGRWDDIMELWPNVIDLSTPEKIKFISSNYCSDNLTNIKQLQHIQHLFVIIMGQQLIKDKQDMENNNIISLCAKWAPTQNDKLDKKFGVVKLLCSKMGWSFKTYRKEYTTPLRKYIKIVETFMCEDSWNTINYSEIPSCAMRKLSNAFENHSPEIFNAWKLKLKEGLVTVNAKQLFPHELVYDIKNLHQPNIIKEKQWEVLELEAIKLGILTDSVCVVDVSGSMEDWGYQHHKKIKPNFTPMDVAIALGLLIANTVQGPFHNHVITFHSTPKFHLIKKDTLLNRVNSLKQMEWGGYTDLQATFDLILNKAKLANLSQEDMPKRLFIISDMQFNQTATHYINGHIQITNFKDIDNKYKDAGYTRPNIVFWNVTGSTYDFPVTSNEQGTAMVAGFSISVLKAILKTDQFNSYSIMKETINDKRYDPIRQSLQS